MKEFTTTVIAVMVAIVLLKLIKQGLLHTKFNGGLIQDL